MDDRVRRYLEQQVTLGGAEVILPGRSSVEPPRGVARAEAEAPLVDQREAERPSREGPPAAARPELRAESPAPTAAARPAEPEAPKAKGGADWRTGAPPIPGPGLVVDPPPQDLLTPRGKDYPDLAAIAKAVAACKACFLGQGRTNTVPGEGNPEARLLLVGEGPGQTEDQTGRPFVGRAGELLNDILKAIGFAREEVFICNVVKCRPPQNRKPLPDEMSTCMPFLEAQIDLVRPKVILALGATAAEALLKVRRSLSELRTKVHSYRGVPLVVTYHPAALLRNPNWKKPTWDDVRIARQLVDR